MTYSTEYIPFPGTRQQVVSEETGEISHFTYPIGTANYLTWARSSTTTPGYHSLLKKRAMLPHNPFAYNKVRERFTAGNVVQNGYWPHSSNYGCLKETGFHVSPMRFDSQMADDIQVCRDRLRLKLREKIKDGKVNLANAIAEREQTISLFASTAKSIAKMLFALKRADYRAALEAINLIRSASRGSRVESLALNRARAIADAWIAVQYGWKPLIADVVGAAESLAKSRSRRPLTMHAQQLAQHTYTFVEETPYATVTHVSTLSLTCKGSCVYQLENTVANTLKEIGLTNPLSPAWELLPWSFVVDWFIPIGSTIAAMDSTLGLDFIDGSEFLVFKKKHTATAVYHKNGYVGGTYSEVENFLALRTVYTDFPSLPMPHFKSPLGWYHSLNALALAFQRFH